MRVEFREHLSKSILPTNVLNWVFEGIFASRHFVPTQGNCRVVTRYMGSGITASGSGSWTPDPGSQVIGSGSANFFLSWRGSRIDRFLDTLFFMRNKNIPFCKEKGLFSGLLKNLYTSILLRFRHAISCLKLFSLAFHAA